MSVAIGIAAAIFFLSACVFALIVVGGKPDDKGDAKVATAALAVAWLAGGLLVGLVAARLAQ